MVRKNKQKPNVVNLDTSSTMITKAKERQRSAKSKLQALSDVSKLFEETMNRWYNASYAESILGITDTAPPPLSSAPPKVSKMDVLHSQISRFTRTPHEADDDDVINDDIDPLAFANGAITDSDDD